MPGALAGLAAALLLAACGQSAAGRPGPAARSEPLEVVLPNRVAAASPAAPSPAPADRLARDHYRQVPALGELDVASFDQAMRAMTAWVSPQAGCMHCHVEGDMASEAKPAKQTARQMLRMVQHLNNDWKPHVGHSGVTCHTCHRGQPRPPQRWAVDEPGMASLAGPSPDARVDQARAADGRRLLRDINADGLAAAPDAGPDAAPDAAHVAQFHCGTCHQGARQPQGDDAPRARDLAALWLLPTERADAATVVTALPLRPVPRRTRGHGRVQFYATPNVGTPLRGVFILPGEAVVALRQAPRFTAVHYVNPRTGGQAWGWVLSERLGGG